MFTDAHFDAMFQENADPWGFRTRWYEQRKRAILLASLPARRFDTAFEPGCANGEFSAALALRCGHLLATDISRAALALAAERVRNLPQVTVGRMEVPRQWPERLFDLIVINELAYFLDANELEQLCGRIDAALTANGVLLACHWRHPIESCTLRADAIHQQLDARLPLTRMATHTERDFILDIWSRDGVSVAARENLA